MDSGGIAARVCGHSSSWNIQEEKKGGTGRWIILKVFDSIFRLLEFSACALKVTFLCSQFLAQCTDGALRSSSIWPGSDVFVTDLKASPLFLIAIY